MMPITKDEIIAAIKRLAEQLGRAPGREIFERETGIKPSAYTGVYWRSWSEALQAAGFEPNELQKKMSPDAAVRHFAELARHIGSVPTSADIRLHRKTNAGYPVPGSLFKCFGSKSQLVRATSQFVREHSEFSDLTKLFPEQPTTIESPVNLDRGWVYLLQSGCHFKIGRSDNLEQRIKQISTAMPDKIELVHAIKTDDPVGIEAYWHRRFEQYRANGEWFKLSHADVQAFKSRKSQ